MLRRREIENYIFDSEVLSQYMIFKGETFDEVTFNTHVLDIVDQDLKLGSTISEILTLCNFSGSERDFKLELSKHFIPSMAVYRELREYIF